MRFLCASCGSEIENPLDANVLREIRGWARQREQGGQNHVIDRKETGALMCAECSSRLRAGLAPRQDQLL